MDEKTIAENIKKARLERNLTIDRLAKLSGLTKGYISKIENSGKAPPFSTLLKLAAALNTDVNILLSPSGAQSAQDIQFCLVRSDERQEVTTKGTLYGYQYESLAHKKLGKNMEPYIITPAREGETIFSHEGEEFMYMLEGTQEFIYGNKRYILNKGDAIYFDSAVPHTGRSIGEEDAKVLTVTYNYKRC